MYRVFIAMQMHAVDRQSWLVNWHVFLDLLAEGDRTKQKRGAFIGGGCAY